MALIIYQPEIVISFADGSGQHFLAVGSRCLENNRRVGAVPWRNAGASAGLPGDISLAEDRAEGLIRQAGARG